jgi:hypothetical protein
MTRGCRKLHNEELRNLYSSPSILKSRRIGSGGHVARMGTKRNAYSLLMGKRPLGRPRHRWVGNIKINLGKMG